MAADSGDFITVREAARKCRRTTETIRRWIWNGKLRARKLGNQLFIRRADLARVSSSVRKSHHVRVQSAPLPRREEDRDYPDQMAVLEEARALQERIRRRIGGTLDLLEALDRSRESHP